MFGIKHVQFDAMTYVLHFSHGEVVKEGRGLSFYYYAPNSSLVAIPLGGNDLPFVFAETTKDYQQLTVQGQISYQITDPKRLADTLDFTVNAKGQYKKNDLEKLHQRTINAAQAAVAQLIQQLDLREALAAGGAVKAALLAGLKDNAMIDRLGIDIADVNIIAVRADPDMTRALETETRERLQQEADEAIYERRNFAVEQERKIKESELNTEIALEEKQKQITEKKMETELLRQTNQRKLKRLNLEGRIEHEKQRVALVEQESSNQRQAADTRAYVAETTLAPYRSLDWKKITALQNNPDPKLNLSLAFRELAENAGKIGRLNISPDLLERLTDSK